MPLHPDARNFIEAVKNIAQPPEATVQEFREAANALVKPGDPLPIGKVEDKIIAGGDGQPMLVEIYTPEGSGPFPTLVWIRGGSFSRTTMDQVDPIRRAFAKFSGCIVAGVDQRLSPEAQYPDPLNDAEAGARWVIEHASEINADPKRIGIAGESSGTNIAAALTLRARQKGSPKFAFQVLFAPLLDATLGTASMSEFEDGYVLTKRQLDWAFSQYAPNVKRTDPMISPLLTPSVAGLPPAAILTIEYDPVRDEGEQYAKRLADAGVLVKHARIDGMLHHFSGPNSVPTMIRLLKELLAELPG